MAKAKLSNKQARRLEWRIRRDKKLSGTKALPTIIANIFGAIMLTFIVAAVINICFNGLGNNNVIHYLFAALQISYPYSDDSPEGARMIHIIMYLIMGLITMVLLPFFTAALNNLMSQNILEVQEGRKVYKYMSDHCVVIGYNNFAIQIIRRMLTGNKRYAILLTLQKATEVRESLQAMLPSELEDRVIIYAGDAVSTEKIKDLCLAQAAEACLLEETTDHSSYYTRNLTILGNISQAVVERTTPLILYMQINNSTAYSLFRKIDIPQRYLMGNGHYTIDLRPFNFYENWSRLLWSYHVMRKNGQCYYDPLDFEPLENTDKHVHLVISHFDIMGRALLLEALRICHYPNFIPAQKTRQACNKAVITVFDSRWHDLRDEFLAQYGKFADIEDIELQFYNSDITSPEARDYLSQWAQDPNKLLTIAMCEAESDDAMAKAISLPEAVYYQKDNFKYVNGKKRPNSDVYEQLPCNSSRVRVLIRQHQFLTADDIFEPDKNILKNFGLDKHPTYPNVKMFGMLSEDIGYSQLNDDAAICINGIYSEKSAQGESIFYIHQFEECVQNIRRVCTDHTTVTQWRDSWFHLAENMKWANRFQVDMYKFYIDTQERMKQLSAKEQSRLMDQLVEVEHRRWLAERIVAGWRQCDAGNGETRVKERRIHNCIIPFDQLSDEEKVKDYNVIATAKLLADLTKES